MDLRLESEAVGDFARSINTDLTLNEAIVRLPDHKTLPIRAQRKSSSNPLQVEGQLDIAKLRP